MSKLTVTTVDTGSVTTNLTLTTANTLGSSIVVSATDGTIDLRGNVINTGRFSGNVILSGANNTVNAVFRVVNSSSNVFFAAANGNIAIGGNVTPVHELRVDGPVSLAGAVSDITTLSASGSGQFGNEVVIKGGSAAGEGGQIILGYGNNLASGITTQANNTYNIDVPGGNTGSTPLLRIFAQNGDATTTAILNAANTGRIHVGSISEQTDSTFKVTGTANVTSNLNVGGNVAVTDRVTANVFVGAVGNPFNPIVTVGANAGAIIAPSTSYSSATFLALTANRQYFVPVYIPFVFTTTTLTCEVLTLGTSSSIRMNIYAATANGAPTGSPLAADVLVSSATTGIKTGSYVTTLKPGLYWASMVCNATAPTVKALNNVSTIGSTNISGTLSAYAYLYGGFTFGPMGAYSSIATIDGQVTVAAPAAPLIAIY